MDRLREQQCLITFAFILAGEMAARFLGTLLTEGAVPSQQLQHHTSGKLKCINKITDKERVSPDVDSIPIPNTTLFFSIAFEQPPETEVSLPCLINAQPTSTDAVTLYCGCACTT
eukprot:g39587.t1